MYAAPIKTTKPTLTLPTSIDPSDITKPSMVPMYAAPVKPGIIPSSADLPKVPEPTTPPKPKNKPLTPEQKKAAETMGKYTARYLAGYTTDTEQEAIVNNINKVNNSNVTEFLRSYEAHRNDEIVKADAFFTQVFTEYGFDEKQDIMKRVALRLAANLAEGGNTVDANTIKGILKHKEISAADARMLDKIYQDNI